MISSKDVCMGLMTWPEIKQRLKETDIALVPVGQTEQHGLHACTDLDSRNAEGIATRAALAVFETAKPVVAPIINYGYSDLPNFKAYPGVFSLRGETLTNLCYDVAFSLVRMGFSKIIFVNGHDANPPFINEAMRRIVKKTGAFCAMGHISEMNNDYSKEILKQHGMPFDFGHACLIETSIAMAFGMEIRTDKMSPHYFEKDFGPLKKIFPDAPHGISFPAWECEDITSKMWHEGLPGTKGNPEGSSAELGEKLIDATIKPLVYLIDSIREYKPKLKENLDFEL